MLREIDSPTLLKQLTKNEPRKSAYSRFLKNGLDVAKFYELNNAEVICTALSTIRRWMEEVL